MDEFASKVWVTLQDYAEKDDTGLSELRLGRLTRQSRPIAFTVARFSGAIGYARVMAYFIDRLAATGQESPDDLAEMIWDSTWDPSYLDIDFGDIGFGGPAARQLAVHRRSPEAWRQLLLTTRMIRQQPGDDTWPFRPPKS